MPLVSVIIPNFNHERFLVQRIESVLTQTFRDTEVIGLDDASKDGSLAIMRRYEAQGKLRLICNERNSGSPFAQWNRGASVSSGTYLWFAESDDYCSPDFLSTLVPILEGNPRVGIVYCQSSRVDEHGREVDRVPGSSRRYDESTFSCDFVQSGKQACCGQLFFRSTIPNASAVVLRRCAFEACGGADERMRLCGDWFTWIRILQEWDLAYVAKPMNYFRMPLPASQRHAARWKHCPVSEWVCVMRYIEERHKIPPFIRQEACLFLAQLWGEFAFNSVRAGSGLLPALKQLRAALAFDPFLFARLPQILMRRIVGSYPVRAGVD